MMLKQPENSIYDRACGEGRHNTTRIKLEKEAMILITSLSDDQLLKIMEEIETHPAS